MSTSTLSAEPRVPALDAAQRLAVAWQHPFSRQIRAVGLLTCSAAGFTFAYLRAASDVEGFQPFLGFPDLDRRYESSVLPPLFAQRVMRSSRPDFARYVRALWLEQDASDWSILARAQGQREGDGIRVFPEPEVDAGGVTTATFFVHGLRHRMNADPLVERALDALVAGERLSLVDEPDNPADARAVLVAARTGTALAWVPSILLPHLQVARSVAEPEVTVARSNGRDVPPGFRLLVTLRGSVPVGYRAFDGPAWATGATS